MAFWPVLTSRKLALLTDGVVALTEKTGDLNNVIWIFGSLALMLLSQAVYTAVENYLSQIDLEKTTRYIRQTIIRHGCRVKYKYIENYDDFKQKVDFAKPKPDKGLAKAYSRYCPFYRG
jgi:ABC-type transport system involved in cytochrome bd biosynthesis fused ATPase/permease subunit